MFNFGKKVLYLRIVIASLFKDLGDSKMLIYCLGLLVALSTLLSGLILTNKKRGIFRNGNIPLLCHYQKAILITISTVFSRVLYLI